MRSEEKRQVINPHFLLTPHSSLLSEDDRHDRTPAANRVARRPADLATPSSRSWPRKCATSWCASCSIRPAHFASNLGVVELCLALHPTFDFRRDRLIWDTGHQIYPHKLITGRFAQFGTIRTRGGLMGYPNPHESPYDLFMTGHAGCSVSPRSGLHSGDELLGEGDRHPSR